MYPNCKTLFILLSLILPLVACAEERDKNDETYELSVLLKESSRNDSSGKEVTIDKCLVKIEINYDNGCQSQSKLGLKSVATFIDLNEINKAELDRVRGVERLQFILYGDVLKRIVSNYDLYRQLNVNGQNMHQYKNVLNVANTHKLYRACSGVDTQSLPTTADLYYQISGVTGKYLVDRVNKYINRSCRQ